MYSEEFKRLFDMMGKAQKMVLATCSNNRVTARTMSFILENEKLYFQTDKNFTKCRQIKENPLVAVCWNNVQIEGRCNILGHPSDSKNQFFNVAFKKYYKGSYDAYSHLKSEVVYEVTPVLAAVWGYENGKPYREFYDFSNRSYRKEYYLPE